MSYKQEEKNRLCKKKYRENNREKLRIKSLEYYYKNIEKMISNSKKWNKDNAEKRLNSYLKHINKLGLYNSMTGIEYHAALYGWAKTIKKKFENKCQVCFSSKNLHAHHVFPKAKHPQLSLNLNNGVLFCETHHRELHNLGGV